MKVRYLILFFGILCSVFSCEKEAGEQVKDYYIKYYGSDGDQTAADMVVNTDGTMMILGTSEFNNNRKIYLSKVSSEGDIVWEKFLGLDAENAKDIEPIIAGAYAGGYLVLSNTTTDSEGNTAIKVLRVDGDGNKIDSLKIDNNYLPSNYANSVTPLSDGGFIITGNSTDISLVSGDNGLTDPPEQTDLLTLRFDESLIQDPEFLISRGRSPEAIGVKIFEISLSEFYFAGSSNSLIGTESDVPANYDFNYWLYSLTYDAFNNATIVEHFSGVSTEQEKLSAMAGTQFGDYFSVGTVLQTGGIQRIYASRTVGGFSVTDKTVTMGDEGSEGISLAPSGPSDVLIVGNELTSGGSRNIWLTKVNRNFDTEPGFPRSFGAAGNDDTASAVAELPNGDIVVLGTMYLVNQNKIALIKLRANGGF